MGYRVLVVEDEKAVAMSLVSMLQDDGHEVVQIAATGEQAITAVADNRPDVALVDLRLPGMDGIETTRRLVEDHNLAVIIITAYADSQFVKGAAEAGAYAYLLKPVTKEAICANLELAVVRSNELGVLRKEAEDTKSALEVRKLAERAKYVLMDRLSLTEEEAFAHIKQKCRNQNKTLRQVAAAILAADEAFLGEIAKDPPKKTKSLA